MTETVWPIKPKIFTIWFFFQSLLTPPDIKRRAHTSKPVPEPI